MDTSISIGKVLKQVLEKVHPKKVFPLIAPANTTYPFVIYRRSNITSILHKDPNCQDTTRVEIVVASTSYEEGIEIAEKIRAALEYKAGVFGNIKINYITLATADESYLSDAYIQRMQFDFKIDYSSQPN